MSVSDSLCLGTRHVVSVVLHPGVCMLFLGTGSIVRDTVSLTVWGIGFSDGSGCEFSFLKSVTRLRLVVPVISFGLS